MADERIEKYESKMTKTLESLKKNCPQFVQDVQIRIS